MPTTAETRPPDLTYEESVLEERDRLRRVIDHIAESVIVSVVGVGHGADTHEITWGCGICEGVRLDLPDDATGRGRYAHLSWCPRKP